MGRVHGVHGGLGHRVELGVDVVLLRVVLVHHAEGVQTHLQLHCGPTDAALAQTLDELGREVQPGRGRGRRAFPARVHRLVQLLVAGVVADVGRQRRMPHGMQGLVQRRQRRGKTRDTFAALAVPGPIDDLGGKHHLACSVREIHHGPGTRLQALARPHEHLPEGHAVRPRLGASALAQQKHLGRPARAPLGAEQARRHDPRLVGHEQIPRPQVVDDVLEDTIFNFPAFAIHHEQSALVAHGRWLLSDKLFGQVVVEIIGSHEKRSFECMQALYYHDLR